ncbi:MAG: hypothetical protein KC776_38535 [Myxococcales bacterium]|nr:hypothetical protein [Myxococcales bacterium]MCB9576227.1 hypothetical protein [Polyangiaceae bacterium]
MRPRAPAEFPGDEGRDAVTRALAKLSLSDRAIAPEALCAPSGRGYRAASAAASQCSAPPEHWLADPLLRDARRERSFGDLGSADYYRSTVRKLEDGLVRSRPRTRARRTILEWLSIALDRLRRVESTDPSDTGHCLVHYLGLLADEPAPGARPSRRSDIQYTRALELELLGWRTEALSEYRQLARGEPFGAGFAGAHAALGDAALRASFCDEAELRVAHGHYLVAASIRAPIGSPLAGYARVRLAQVEQSMGALGPAGRQLELATAALGGSYLGPERRRLATLAKETLRQNLLLALGDGTLPLVMAYAPGGGACQMLLSVSLEQRDAAVRHHMESTLLTHCGWMKEAPDPRPVP